MKCLPRTASDKCAPAGLDTGLCSGVGLWTCDGTEAVLSFLDINPLMLCIPPARHFRRLTCKSILCKKAVSGIPPCQCRRDDREKGGFAARNRGVRGSDGQPGRCDPAGGLGCLGCRHPVLSTPWGKEGRSRYRGSRCARLAGGGSRTDGGRGVSMGSICIGFRPPAGTRATRGVSHYNTRTRESYHTTLGLHSVAVLCARYRFLRPVRLFRTQKS